MQNPKNPARRSSIPYRAAVNWNKNLARARFLADVDRVRSPEEISRITAAEAKRDRKAAKRKGQS